MAVGWLLDRRIFMISILLITGFSGMGLAFWFVQVVHGDHYLDLATHNRIRRVVIPAPRGRILDRTGHIIVDNRPSFNVVLDWEALKRKENLQELSRFLGLSIMKLKEKIRMYRGVPYLPMVLKRDVNMTQIIEVEDMRLKIPELGIEVKPVRRYINGNWAGQILGYVGAIDADEFKRLKRKGYRHVDVIGKVGMELFCEPYLRGLSGGMQVQVDSRGYRDEVIQKQNPIPGHDIWLTLDQTLQSEMEHILEGHIGAGIAMNPQTGEILAMVSKPGIDPNIFTNPSERVHIKEIFRDKRRPLLNRATQGEASPGSPFKLLVALEALKRGVINKNTTFRCDGKYNLGKATFHCWKTSGHGRINLLEAIQGSCNVYFCHVGQKLGPNGMAFIAREFGLGRKTKIDVGNERKGLVPDVQWKKEKLGESWYGGETLNYAVGQGFISVTPLQMVVLISAIANGGTLWRPYLMKRVSSRNGSSLIEIEPFRVGRVSYSKEHMDIVREGMRRVVEAENGTGKRARVKNISVAGKTGTIQVAKGDGFIKHGWFICFAPFNEPKIALVLFIENIESGGRDIAPLAGKILEKYFLSQKI